MVSWRAQGLRPWLWQRLSAPYMGVFILAALVFVSLQAPLDYGQWRAWVAQPLVNIGFILFWLSLLTHAWVGMRDVVMDYVHHDGVRFTVLVIIGLALAGMGVWVVEVLLKVAVT